MLHTGSMRLGNRNSYPRIIVHVFISIEQDRSLKAYGFVGALVVISRKGAPVFHQR